MEMEIKEKRKRKTDRRNKLDKRKGQNERDK